MLRINFILQFIFKTLHFLIASFSIGAIIAFFYLNLVIIPDGNTGIMINKLEKNKIRSLSPGVHFIIDAFVPEKYQIIYFSGFDRNITIEHKENLKYTEFLKLSDYFQFKLSVTVTYEINTSKILSLYEMNNNKLIQIDEFVKNRFHRILEKKYYEFYKKEADLKSLEFHFIDFLKVQNLELKEKWKEWFYDKEEPIIRLKNIYVNHIHLPDNIIYYQISMNMPQIINAKRKAFLERIFDESKLETDKVRSYAEYEKAVRYSELIRKNPFILNFLQIDRLNPFASKVIINQTNSKIKNNSNLSDLKEEEISGASKGLVLPPIQKEN